MTDRKPDGALDLDAIIQEYRETTAAESFGDPVDEVNYLGSINATPHKSRWDRFWDWLDRLAAPRTTVPTTSRDRIVPNIYRWSLDEITAMSGAIRTFHQPDSPGFQSLALVALNALRADEDRAYKHDVELVARAMAQYANPTLDIDRPSRGGHYMSNLPLWMSFVEYARPAVAAYRKRCVRLKPSGF